MDRALGLFMAAPDGWRLRDDLERAVDAYRAESRRAASGAAFWVGIPAGLFWAIGEKLIFARADFGDFGWLIGTIGLLLPLGVAWAAGMVGESVALSRQNAKYGGLLASTGLALRAARAH